MLIRRHDAARDDKEWRDFLLAHDFGQLIASGKGRDVPVVVPTHFVYDGDRTIRLHLAGPNPIWDALAASPHVLLSVIDAYTYIPTGWNANAGMPVEHGIPTSYYAAVQAIGRAAVIDDPEGVAAILRTQLAHFQPEGGHAEVRADAAPYASSLSGIRGIVIDINEVRAKFKFGGNKAPAHRRRIAELLERRHGPRDLLAREHLLRREP
ncbi:MAG: FMN-binding negative transcriptional regulator [Chloroflexi bacterium]|nr:FMN-binding negative transcriptional regulator [Chloroflexota bacterium]